MNKIFAFTIILLFVSVTGIFTIAQSLPQKPRINVAIITDEAEAVLNIASMKAKGITPAESDWQKLFSSEGYTRLKKRESFMKRPFEDSAFCSFVLSEDLALRIPELRKALNNWKKTDINGAAESALAYLPEEAVIKAKVYPVIKPRSNSFVFEIDTDPAIFMYIDPGVSPKQFYNTLTHELHHIGTGSMHCNDRNDSTIPENIKTALDWMSGFSEGRAMLAAAGSHEVHPHLTGDSLKRAVWDKDYARAAEDMKKMESFFFKLLDGRLNKEEQYNEGMSFIFTEQSPQGAFYTVGYLMSSAVEKIHGRERLIASMCNPAMFLIDYNKAAQHINETSMVKLPLWSTELLDRISLR